MRIALDYDDTFDKDPIFWTQVVDLAKQRGHSISFVTFRYSSIATENGNDKNQDIKEDAALLGIDVVYCEFEQKASIFKADVWIDDSPQFIPTVQQLKKHIEYFDIGEVKLAKRNNMSSTMDELSKELREHSCRECGKGAQMKFTRPTSFTDNTEVVTYCCYDCYYG